MSGLIFQISGVNGFVGGNVQVNPLKQYILVAGLFYPDDTNGYKLSGSFGKYSERYIKQILLKRNKEDIIIHNVDILEGKIIKSEYIGSNTPKETISIFDKVTDINYKKLTNRFLSEGKVVISKTDIYKIVEEIGKSNPNTLQEINIFSHAFWNGPILINTDSGPDDHDMRKDDITGGLINLTDFKNAFTTTGEMKIWGCSFPTALNSLFSRIRKNIEYRTDKTIPDNTVFKYSPNHFFGKTPKEDRGDLTTLINGMLGTAYKVTEQIDLSFLQIKKIACANFLNTYASNLVKHIGIKTQAALPATYSEITPNFHISKLTKENVKFYEMHLKVNLGELDYGIYDTATVSNLISIYNS